MRAERELREAAGRILPEDTLWVRFVFVDHAGLGTHARCAGRRYVDPAYPPVQSSRRWAMDRDDWDVREIAAGHDAMVSASEMVVDILLDIVNE